jgi:N-acetyl-anhydromuramyl-L-alanine amidase AmpD
MNKIIIHWTAGTYQPNTTDLEHYHFLIDGEGKKHNGKFKPEDNENCNDGKYAAHTGGGNTGAIGVSMCAMAGFNSAASCGNYPITPVQLEACFKLCAELCKKYNIPVENVWTHYEFGINHPDTTSHGKIDIIYLPPYPLVKRNEVGGFIRSKIRWYLNKLD